MCGPGEAARFALTYDDGPGQGTPALLDLLAARSVRATFFMVGSQIEAAPQLAGQVVSRGHEVGSHSYAHYDHQLLDDGENSPESAVEDMVRGAEAIERLLGVESWLYRAPYGHFVAATLAEARARGWTCVMWSAAGRDWDPDAGAESVAQRVEAQLGPGAIVLLHDARHGQQMDPAPMLSATELILDCAGAIGLEPVTVGELLSGSTQPHP